MSIRSTPPHYGLTQPQSQSPSSMSCSICQESRGGETKRADITHHSAKHHVKVSRARPSAPSRLLDSSPKVACHSLDPIELTEPSRPSRARGISSLRESHEGVPLPRKQRCRGISPTLSRDSVIQPAAHLIQPSGQDSLSLQLGLPMTHTEECLPSGISAGGSSVSTTAAAPASTSQQAGTVPPPRLTPVRFPGGHRSAAKRPKPFNNCNVVEPEGECNTSLPGHRSSGCLPPDPSSEMMSDPVLDSLMKLSTSRDHQTVGPSIIVGGLSCQPTRGVSVKEAVRDGEGSPPGRCPRDWTPLQVRQWVYVVTDGGCLWMSI